MIYPASSPASPETCRRNSSIFRHASAFFCLLAALWLTGCASLPDKVERPVSNALANSGETQLGRAVAARAAAAGTHNDSAFALIGSAELAFASRLTLIRAAEKTLDLQYYAIFSDDTTERLFEAMREAAGRGVRIRILLDDFNTSGKNAQVLKLAFEKNIELRLFNPLPGSRSSLLLRIIGNLKDTARIQRRMHNKMFVADNAVAIMGGRNLGETYFGRSKDTNFVDIDILAAGRIARDLSRSFDQYWNNPLSYPVQSLMTEKEFEALAPASGDNSGSGGNAENYPGQARSGQDAQLAQNAPAALQAEPVATDPRLLTWTWASSALLVDKPSKITADADTTEVSQDTTVDGLLQLMAEARTRLLIVSPYFVPGERMMREFAALRQRGVEVRVLTNSLASNDAPAAHVGYARYRRRLLAMGVELHEMRAEQQGTFSSFGSGVASRSGLGSGESSRSGAVQALGSGSAGASRASLHSKVVVIDDRLLVIGSMNLDLRSQLQNSEVAVVIRNRGIAAEATRLIEPTLAAAAYRVELAGDRLVWHAPAGSGLNDSSGEPDASIGLKLLIKLIGPFAPEEML